MVITVFSEYDAERIHVRRNAILTFHLSKSKLGNEWTSWSGNEEPSNSNHNPQAPIGQLSHVSVRICDVYPWFLKFFEFLHCSMVDHSYDSYCGAHERYRAL